MYVRVYACICSSVLSNKPNVDCKNCNSAFLFVCFCFSCAVNACLLARVYWLPLKKSGCVFKCIQVWAFNSTRLCFKRTWIIYVICCWKFIYISPRIFILFRILFFCAHFVVIVIRIRTKRASEKDRKSFCDLFLSFYSMNSFMLKMCKEREKKRKKQNDKEEFLFNETRHLHAFLIARLNLTSHTFFSKTNFIHKKNLYRW